MQEFRMEQLTGRKYREVKFDKVILAVGSAENHGDHLPFGTDTIVSYELALKVAERVPGLLVLPPVTYGMSEHYAHFPLTISLRSETLVAVLKDILRSLLKHGIEKIFILNGHDGNIAPIEVAAREIKVENPRAKIAVLEAWWITAGKLLPPDTFEVWAGLGHGGEGETSVMLALHPELVEMEHAKGRVPEDLPEEVQIKWLFHELTPYGASGDPTKATAEKGRKVVEALVDHIMGFIQQMDAKDWKYDLSE
ncbi:MAG TPA: creatininase family protein [Anaerolineae bacterium]|nr:creatininase family protein [Anaerolineae bacterium]